MHSIERIQKVIDDYFVDMLDKKGDWVIRPNNEDLVRFAVKILEEFKKDEEERWTPRGASKTSSIYGEESRGGRLF